ncbi:MAG: hypothetical protein ACFFDT_36665 [Candidatus Hodarchaeota archaeon]
MPAIFLILIVAIASYYLNIPISHFTRDPLAIRGGHPFLGIISNIGAILWSFSVAICFFSYVLLKTSKKPHDGLGFIMFGGFISSVLLLDDLFMLHETIYPRYFGVSEKIVFLFYGVLILFYLVRFRKIIIETDFIFILLAVFFFALSALVDMLPESLLSWHHLFEDGLKFFGIISWFGYQFSVCFREVQSVAYTLAPNKSINWDG